MPSQVCRACAAKPRALQVPLGYIFWDYENLPVPRNYSRGKCKKLAGELQRFFGLGSARGIVRLYYNNGNKVEGRREAERMGALRDGGAEVFSLILWT